jgi:hypothetical protein
LLTPTAAAGDSGVVADITKVLDGSGGHRESLDAGTEPARPLMGHSGGRRDRASAGSPWLRVYRGDDAGDAGPLHRGDR